MKHRTTDMYPVKHLFLDKVKMWSENASSSEFTDWEFQLKLLSDIGYLITPELPLEEVLAIIYSSINQLMDAYQFTVGLYNEEEGTIIYKGMIENSRQYPDVIIDAHVPNRFAFWCIQHEKEIFINDIDVEYKKYVTNIPVPMAGSPPKAALYVPLKERNKVKGVIVVRSPNKNVYQQHHLYILKTLGSFVIKTIALSDILSTAIRKTEGGKKVWYWTDEKLQSVKAKKLLASLTEREKDVLLLLVSGLSNKEIASKLCVSAGTIKTHTLNIYRKMEVPNRTAAILKAIELNWVQ